MSSRGTMPAGELHTLDNRHNDQKPNSIIYISLGVISTFIIILYIYRQLAFDRTLRARHQPHDGDTGIELESVVTSTNPLPMEPLPTYSRYGDRVVLAAIYEPAWLTSFYDLRGAWLVAYTHSGVSDEVIVGNI
jgi:predicted permease